MKVLGLRVENYICDEVKLETGGLNYIHTDIVRERHILCCITDEDRLVELDFSYSEGESNGDNKVNSWSEINILYVKNFRTFNHIPVKHLELDESILDNGYLFNNKFIEYSYDGGDSYMPSGNYQIDMRYFRETKIMHEKRPVWVFRTSSMVGEIYASSDLDMDIYNTDTNAITEDIHQSIIIISEDTSLTNIKKMILGKPEVDLYIMD